MKVLGMVLLVGIMMFCVAGCLTTGQQTRLNEITQETREEIDALVTERLAVYRLLEKQTTEVRAKVDSGTITLSDGQGYLSMLKMELENSVDRINGQIETTKNRYSDEKQNILESGKTKVDYYLGIVISILGSFFGVNAYRSRKHPLSKEIV